MRYDGGGSVQSHFNGVHMDSGRGGWSISHLCRRCWGLISIYFHQLSILKYNRDSGKASARERIQTQPLNGGWSMNAKQHVGNTQKICLHKAKTRSKKHNNHVCRNGPRSALNRTKRERKKKKKASMLVSFISISFRKPLLKWHNGADIKRSRAGGWTKTTARSEQKQGCAGAADLSWGHNGL